MEVILKEDVPKLGHRGEVVKVAEGYGRNYLLPHRLAIEATTANRAVIDYASRNKDRLLFDVYRMGHNSIERGSRDTWTITPRRIQGVKKFDDLRDPASRDYT